MNNYAVIHATLSPNTLPYLHEHLLTKGTQSTRSLRRRPLLRGLGKLLRSFNIWGAISKPGLDSYRINLRCFENIVQ
jgi:hypothetical protein